MGNEPFIHKFESQSHKKYIFDVNTNQIIEVDSIAYDIIDDINKFSSSEIISKWKIKYKSKEIKKTLPVLFNHRKDGIFSTHHPEKMTRHYTSNYLSEIICQFSFSFDPFFSFKIDPPG